MTLRRTQCHLPVQLLTIWDAFASPSVISLHWVFISAQTHAAPHYWDSAGGHLMPLSGQCFGKLLWLQVRHQITRQTGFISQCIHGHRFKSSHSYVNVSNTTITWVIFLCTNMPIKPGININFTLLFLHIYNIRCMEPFTCKTLVQRWAGRIFVIFLHCCISCASGSHSFSL